MDANKYIQLAYLDWEFNQDEQNIYRFFADRKTHCLKEKDRVVLTAEFRDVSQLGEVLKVEEDGLLIQTDEWLDISEAYSIEVIDISKMKDASV